MLNQTQTFYGSNAMEVVTMLAKTENSDNTLAVMTDNMYQEIRNIVSKPPKDEYQTPDGKPSSSLISELVVFDCYTLRVRKVLLDGNSTCWWVVLSIFSTGGRNNFSAKLPGKVLIIAKK